MSKFFVMIHAQGGQCVIPLTEEDGEVAMFEDVDSATSAAWDNDMAASFGYDIFQMGHGVDGGDGIA